MSIWDFKEIKSNLAENDLLTLSEGNTTEEIIRDGKTEIVIKREDKNPTGSWKDRGSAFKLSELKLSGINEAVISSSGNAAISYIHYSKLIPNFILHIVVSTKVNKVKLELIKKLIEGTNHKLYIEELTRKKSIQIAATNKIPNLRSSIDNEIVKGYWSLGFEISKHLNKKTENKDIGIFLPVSSGTAFVGVAQGVFMKVEQEYLMPRLFACQTQSVHPIASMLSSYKDDNELGEESLADSIIDTIALRSPQVIKAIKETNGAAFAINNTELNKANSFCVKNGVKGLSYTSLLAIAGYLRVKDQFKFKKVICIASGR